MSIYASRKHCRGGLWSFHEVKRRCQAPGTDCSFVTFRVFRTRTRFSAIFLSVARFDGSVATLPRNRRLKNGFSAGIFTTRTFIGVVDHRWVAVAVNCMCNCVIAYPAPSLNISFRHPRMPPRHAFGKWGYCSSAFGEVYSLLVAASLFFFFFSRVRYV